MITAKSVIEVHDEILSMSTGLAGVDEAELEGAIERPNQHIHYNNVDDIFVIAAWYGVSIAKAHAFNDGNKRTGLSVMLTYLDLQGVSIKDHTELDDTMVEIVESGDDHEVIVSALAIHLKKLAVL